MDDAIEVQGIKRYPVWLRVRDRGQIWDCNSSGNTMVWIAFALGWSSTLLLVAGMRFVTYRMGSRHIDADSIRRARIVGAIGLAGRALAVALSMYGQRRSGTSGRSLRLWLLTLPVTLILQLVRWRRQRS